MIPGFLAWMTGDMAPPSSVIANGGGGGRSRGMRRKVSEFDLDRWDVILVEIFNRQIEIRREFNIGNILETSFEFETWNKYP